MPQSLAEYAEWLAERNLRWPAPPKFEPVNAAPYIKPLADIKAVAWDIYGTLLRITDGELMFVHPQAVRMEIALDKTIQEFNMWQSMSRKPGAPWEYMLQMYERAYDELRLQGSGRKGELVEIDAAKIWRKILDKLDKNDFRYDVGQYGDFDEFSEKIAYFFHSALQGVEAAPSAAATLTMISDAHLPQGLIADAQGLTQTQLLRGLHAQGTLADRAVWFDRSLVTLSYLEGVRKPSKSLYVTAATRFQQRGIRPENVLFISSRLREDLIVAKAAGFRTALYAGEKLSLSATASDLRDPTTKPDRLLTQLPQLRDILGI